MTAGGHIVALSGGVGGAKLALGLAQVLPSNRLSIVANTGDDFEHLGLHISPDIDTLLYTLAGVNNPDTGWGRNAETWSFMSELENLRMDCWFKIGDKDLAVHLYRTDSLRKGQSLTGVTADIAARLGVSARVMPMSDDPVRTFVDTDEGRLAFQDYFVRRKCRPAVTGIQFDGSATARPSRAFEQLLQSPETAGIVICPSNPFLSIDPILSIPGIAGLIAGSAAPVVAVSPIVRGDALKGPTARIMTELGLSVTACTVARHYEHLIDGFILDTADGSLASSIAESGLAVQVTNTVMRSMDDRTSLARAVLNFIRQLQNTVSA